MLYKGQKKVIKLFDDYYSMVSEAKYKSIHGKVTDILTDILNAPYK